MLKIMNGNAVKLAGRKMTPWDDRYSAMDTMNGALGEVGSNYRFFAPTSWDDDYPLDIGAST